MSVGVAGQFLFNDQEIIADVPLISGHSVHVDLVPRLQPPISHNDIGRGSHSSNQDNDGASSCILSMENIIVIRVEVRAPEKPLDKNFDQCLQASQNNLVQI